MISFLIHIFSYIYFGKVILDNRDCWQNQVAPFSILRNEQPIFTIKHIEILEHHKENEILTDTCNNESFGDLELVFKGNKTITPNKKKTKT